MQRGKKFGLAGVAGFFKAAAERSAAD